MVLERQGVKMLRAAKTAKQAKHQTSSKTKPVNKQQTSIKLSQHTVDWRMYQGKILKCSNGWGPNSQGVFGGGKLAP